ncbi:hypothetical protein [Pseudoalteromonas sp. Z9A6]|uniref:hypothetical protein n=1 Tax=Pseudoalteromonas sp. Z9A6 TaxID=2686352 RepID=UPI0013FDF13C|nr:hypothetical protein [Pseudoalteromonas sp. Z9A6]
MANYLTLVEQLSTAVEQLNQVLQGDETTTVDINGKVQPSVQKKTLDEVTAKVQLVLDAAADIDAVKYATTAAGIAATTDGQFFSVVSDDDDSYLDLYKNDNDSAEYIKSYPSAEAIHNIPVKEHISKKDFTLSDESGETILSANSNELEFAGNAKFKTLETTDPVSSGLNQQLESPFLYSLTDSSGEMIFAVTKDGVMANGFSTQDGEIGTSSTIYQQSPNAEIDCFPTMGQSNAAGDLGITDPPISTVQEYKNIIPVYDTGSVSTNSAVPIGMIPLAEDIATGYEWTGLNACNQVSKMILNDSGLSVSELNQMYTFKAAMGGSGIPSVGNDSTAVRFKRDIDFGVSYSNQNNKSFNVKAVSFTQGEANNQMTSQDYYDATISMYDWMNDYCKAATGQRNDMKLFTWQIQEDTGVRRAQLIASDRHPNIHVVFPEYALPMKPNAGVHLNNVGMALSGAYYGLAYKRIIIDGKNWEPLRCTGVSHYGGKVILNYNRKGIVIDRDTYGTVDGDGFYVTDDTGSITITSVSISDYGYVSLSLSRDIVGNATVGYGLRMRNRDDEVIVYGGCLRDSDGLSETTTLDGVVYPLHNWSLLFEEII